MKEDYILIMIKTLLILLGITNFQNAHINLNHLKIALSSYNGNILKKKKIIIFLAYQLDIKNFKKLKKY